MAITNMLPQIWSARILAKLEKNLVFAQPGVVNRDYEGDIRADGDRVHIHSFNDLTVSSYTKNSTTISYENLTDSRVTLLIDQTKYFAFSIDDIDAAQMRPKLIDAASDRAAYQLAEVADSYVAGLYSAVLGRLDLGSRQHHRDLAVHGDKRLPEVRRPRGAHGPSEPSCGWALRRCAAVGEGALASELYVRYGLSA
jgi:hypothetical protein